MIILYSLIFLYVMGGLQILMGKCQIPRMLVRIMNHLLASIYISNLPITNRPCFFATNLISCLEQNVSFPDMLTFCVGLLQHWPSAMAC